MDTPTLRSPQHRVSRTAVWYWAARAAIGWLIILAAQVVWLVTDGDGTGLPVAGHVAVLVVTAVVAVAHVTVMPQWRYRVHRWEATSAAVFTQSGWFKQEWRIAPISRIQTVDSERGPLEQLFRLADVTVTTASAAGPIKIGGLDRDTAQRLVAELTATAQATAGDAT
ncbi:PH domain-containing protein [Microbispora hainanensis]|uniref:PH domain-containing protein n=1 Tax=Microbispora hainanensis TaxID=568844 RepID=A0A544Y6Z6_9ACTN|nr:PH domain-containing protein [Microbispora hainanensis]